MSITHDSEVPTCFGTQTPGGGMILNLSPRKLSRRSDKHCSGWPLDAGDLGFQHVKATLNITTFDPYMNSLGKGTLHGR